MQLWLRETWQQIAREMGEKGLERMQTMMNVLCGDEDIKFLTKGQQPYSFYLPGLEATPFHDTSKFEFTRQLETHHDQIKEELLQVMKKERSGFIEYRGDGLDDDKGNMVGSGEWKVKYLYHNFIRNDENCQQFPVTARVLDSLGPQILRGMICFSAIQPGTYIMPHYGPSNMRLTCHLGIIGCQDVDITVGGKTRLYENGKCIIFDDSFKHEVMHRGTELRVTLMLDLWHPGMTTKEITAFQTVMQRVMENLDANHFFHSMHVYKSSSSSKRKNIDVTEQNKKENLLVDE